MPLSSSGNRYIIAFMDYLMKWVKAFAIPDQQSEIIAHLLAENIVCRHGVPEELLSANFLSDFILKLCCALGMKKINTSGYQTDGLLEKFNSTILAMLAKCTDENVIKSCPSCRSLIVPPCSLQPRRALSFCCMAGIHGCLIGAFWIKLIQSILWIWKTTEQSSW